MAGGGAGLAGRFYGAVVRPLLDQVAPGLRHVAARLGSGSDVLGFDDDVSTDHDFGCRVTLLVDERDAGELARLDELLQQHLPEAFEGHPIRIPVSWDPRTWHRVELGTVGGFAESRLGVPVPTSQAPEAWLTFTGQAVLEVTGGPVFHDSSSEYGPLRDVVRWYPDDIWLYVLGCGWARLEQELPLVGRSATRGDDLGSRIIAARLAAGIVYLAYMLERSWAPYPKWAGLRLRELVTGEEIAASLDRALTSTVWRSREGGLVEAAAILQKRQASHGLPTSDPAIVPFFDRPFHGVNLGMQQALRQAIQDPAVRRLPQGVGSIEQWCDNVDLLAHPERRPAIRALYLALLQD